MALRPRLRVAGRLALRGGPARRAKATWVAPEETVLTSVKKPCFNFGPGPGVLAQAVMRRAQEDFLDFQGTGCGVLESTNLDPGGPTHPGEPRNAVQSMMVDTELKLRAILDIPDHYRVLFVHGGAVGQFSAVPLNLASSGCGADIAQIGYWSQRATDEARKYTDVHVPVICEGTIPPTNAWNVRDDASYVHICLNETVEGIEFVHDPTWDHPDIPLVADATSTLLSRPVDVARYGVLYASGGKNLPAGMATVIIREDLLARDAHPLCPQLLDYRSNGGAMMPTASVFESMPNTPPVFPCYMLNLVLDDIADHGGLVSVQRRMDNRMATLYDFIDSSEGFYLNTIDPAYRSRMNAPMRIKGGDRDLERRFVAEAEAEGLYHLFGHPVRGGIRATTYIGLPDEAIIALVDFMAGFMTRYRHH